jgi:deferrochelatase/peroxidase EfeB
VSRRRFLVGGAAAGAGLAAGGVAAAATVTGRDARRGRTEDPAHSEDAARIEGAATVAPFYGAHQSTVLHDPARATATVAFDVIAESRAELAELFRTVTDRARTLSTGEGLALSDPAAPPVDNGILGPTVPGGEIGMIVGVGSSLFDDRYGLGPHKPVGLTPMRTFPNDNLDPARTHGDLSLQLSAAAPDIVVHALRDITKYTRGGMQPRWRLDGFASPPRPSGTPRNLFGFKDGISNPDVLDDASLRRLVWSATDGTQPAWSAGGTFQVVRIIRQLVEFWDRVSLEEQELMIGRRRASGAPLDADTEAAIPDYADDPEGMIIPLTAHMRLANPRTARTNDSRILRRAWSYDRGIDVNGNLDQGLIFTCYQRDIERQFEATQTRLINEPMVDYISPVGGGYFFVLPGVTDRSDWYARGLLT